MPISNFVFETFHKEERGMTISEAQYRFEQWLKDGGYMPAGDCCPWDGKLEVYFGAEDAADLLHDYLSGHPGEEACQDELEHLAAAIGPLGNLEVGDVCLDDDAPLCDEPGSGIVLQFRKLCPEAQAPTKVHADDAGWDFHMTGPAQDLFPGIIYRIPTGLAVALPSGWYLDLRDRSGLASKGIHVLAGIVDSTYRGEIIVILLHAGNDLVELCSGDKICQGLVLPVPHVMLQEVLVLPSSQRGAGGFGSTGR